MAASPSRQKSWPVRIAAREGLQEGTEQKAFVKSTPSAAIRSNEGVFTTLSPYAPAWAQETSSEIIKSIFGGSESALVKQTELVNETMEIDHREMKIGEQFITLVCF